MESLSSSLKKVVDKEAANYIQLAAKIFNRSFPLVEIRYDLKGSASGQFQATDTSQLIRYNPYIFARHFEYCLNNTVPHEVAHYIIYCIYGARGARPHGMEWKSLMLGFGVEPRRTNSLDLSGIPLKRQKRHHYSCNCREHEITSTRHNRIRKKLAKYYCRKCNSELTAVNYRGDLIT